MLFLGPKNLAKEDEIMKNRSWFFLVFLVAPLLASCGASSLSSRGGDLAASNARMRILEVPGAPGTTPTIVNVNDVGCVADCYDLVAYWTEGKAVKGKPEFEVIHKGARVRLSTARHMAMFAANPDYFWPCSNGFCNWGVASKHPHLSNVDPENAWSITRLRDGRREIVDPLKTQLITADGKILDPTAQLCMTLHQRIHARWMPEVPNGIIERAEANFPALEESRNTFMDIRPLVQADREKAKAEEKKKAEATADRVAQTPLVVSP
jgi:hypothetical protein